MTPVNKTRTTYFRLLATTFVLMPLASCLNVVDNNNQYYQYGAITVHALGGGAAQTTATANGVFFSALSASIPDSRSVQNNCAYAAVDTTTLVSQGDLRAGAALTLLTGAGSGKTTTTLPFSSTNGNYIGTSAFTYKSGDSATVSVPGEAGGFLASSVTVRMAEPVILDDITVPLANSSMTLRWNTGDATSAIIVSIKYANPASSAYANEQVLCSLVDDGAEDIPPTFLGPFLLSPANKRSVKITRWRTQSVQPDPRSLLHIVSTVDSTAKLK